MQIPRRRLAEDVATPSGIYTMILRVTLYSEGEDIAQLPSQSIEVLQRGP